MNYQPPAGTLMADMSCVRHDIYPVTIQADLTTHPLGHVAPYHRMPVMEFGIIPHDTVPEPVQKDGGGVYASDEVPCLHLFGESVIHRKGFVATEASESELAEALGTPLVHDRLMKMNRIDCGVTNKLPRYVAPTDTQDFVRSCHDTLLEVQKFFSSCGDKPWPELEAKVQELLTRAESKLEPDVYIMPRREDIKYIHSGESDNRVRVNFDETEPQGFALEISEKKE